MATFREWLHRFWGSFRRNSRDRELEEELRSHLELTGDDRLRRGSSKGALRAARLQAGGIAQAMDALRDQRGMPWIDDLSRDVRHGLRSHRRAPVFTIVALLTLALAIGANTTMFSVVNAVLLRTLPFPSPERLVMLWTGLPGRDRQDRAAYRTVEEWQSRSKSFEDMAVWDPVSVIFTGTDGAERISVSRVSPSFFRLLGAGPLRGRIFTEEEANQRRRLALISHRFWQARFGGSLDVIGASIVLDGFPSEIIGILPEGFGIPGFGADVWEPQTLFPDWEARRGARGAGSWFVIARLQPSVTLDQAQVEMSGLASAIDSEASSADQSRGVQVAPLSSYVVGPRPRLALGILTGAVLCVLLIAAANVASLSLARSTSRAREIATRATLGASPARIIRQLLTEGVTLAMTAGLLGTLLAIAGIRVVRVLGPPDLARLNEMNLDLRVLTWALGISLLTGILVGLAPAITMFRRNLRWSGEGSGRNISGGVAARGVRRVLVVAEFALAIVLLAGAGLLIRSWQLVVSIDPGFRPDRVLSMNIITNAFVAPGQRANFFAEVLEQVESLPGIESAGMIGDLFVSSDTEPIVTAEVNSGITSERVRLRIDEVSDRLFSTLRTPLLRGRFFSSEDGPDSVPVAIINDTMAHRLWQGRDAVGRRLKLGPPDSARPWMTVVGIVGDMRRQGPETEPIPQIFSALAQNPSGNETLLVRTSTADPTAMAGAIQAAIRRVDKRVPKFTITTLDDRLGGYLEQRRFQTSLLVGFSVVALLMAAIGIYGLIHYSVAMRTQEIGIRMAVGAPAAEIFRMTVREGLQLSIAGLIIGLGGALWVGRAGSSLLFGVSAADPLTLTTVSLLLTAVAAVACYFPARRAMKIDPIAALRQE